MRNPVPDYIRFKKSVKLFLERAEGKPPAPASVIAAEVRGMLEILGGGFKRSRRKRRRELEDEKI